MTIAPDLDTRLTESALGLAATIAADAAPAAGGLTWHADVVVGLGEHAPVLGYGDVGPALYDGTAGIALTLAAAARAAAAPDAPPLAQAARGAARHALAGAGDALEGGRLGLYDGATGGAVAAVAAGRALADEPLVAGGAALGAAVAQRLSALAAERPPGVELDVLGGVAGTLLGLGHGAAGVALALAEIGASTGDAALTRAAAGGLDYERGWFDPHRPGWPDLRDAGPGAEPSGWMSAWCHGAIGIGLCRLRVAGLTGDRLALAEASAALQAARDLAVGAGTALRDGHPSDVTACHGLASVAELMLVAATALGVADHARAGGRVAALMIEQREAAGSWPCGLPGAGEIPGLLTGTAGIVLTLLRAAGATDLPTPLLPGPAGW